MSSPRNLAESAVPAPGRSSEAAGAPDRAAPDATAYPDAAAERSRWILSRRGERRRHDVRRAHRAFWEQEPLPTGTLADTLTVLLTSRECPWHCVMCDLWQFTVPGDIPAGAIPKQLKVALAEAGEPAPGDDAEAVFDPPAPRQVKLYNGGSFFDPKAVPPGGYPAIARLVAGFDRVIVECHPALVGDRAVQFQALLHEAAAGRADDKVPVLEVAMGLETVHVEALERLNKRMTLRDFYDAAEFLGRNGMAMRAFVLVQPPFQPPVEAAAWARRSADYAFNCGATAVTLIPTRFGNGAMEALARAGEFAPPTLATIEDALDAALAGVEGRVFADLWDLEEFSHCADCFAARRARLAAMNLTQRISQRIACPRCGGK